MSERTAEAATTVDEDGIRVEKSFTDDAFPVPAVMYTLSSHREDPVRVRIVDRIPESFPMDRVGFHPEYESENWTAYKDHRVEFERVIDPDETVETVFGIRDDDPDLDGFLGTPVIEHVPVGEEIEDVLGAGDTDAVREVLSGDRATLPGMAEDGELLPEDSTEEPAEAPATEEADAESAEDEGSEDDAQPDVDAEEPELDDDEPELDEEPDAPEPRAVDEGTAAVTAHEGDPVGAATETETEPEPADDQDPDEAPETDETGSEGPLDDDRQATADDETEADELDEPAKLPGEGGLAAALAAEIRSGAADEEDIATIEEAFEGGVPRSVDVRIARLQSSVADIEAYADALAEFIDGEGTAREILDGIDERVDAVESEVDALDDRLDAADDERETIASDVDRVDSAVDSASEAVDAVDERVDAVEDDVDAVEGDVRGVKADVRAVEDEVASVDEAVESVQSAVSMVETDVDDLAADVEGVEGQADAVENAVDDLGDDVETLYEEVDRAAERAENAESLAEGADERAADAAERVDDVESGLDRFDEEFDDLWDDLAEVDARLTDIEGRLGEDLDDVAAEIEEINDHLDELDEFRSRLNEAFGP
jgi:peptidoglycan hydrolase CwlO-like protein